MAKKSKKPSPAVRKQRAKERADAALREHAQEMRIENMQWIDRVKEDPGEVATLQQLMKEDLLRVYNTPHKMLGRTAGRQRYRELGHFGESLVKIAFGNHTKFKSAVGLADTTGERKVASRAGKLFEEQQVHRYYQEHIAPFATEPFVEFPDKDIVRVVVSSDHHSAKVDPFAMRVLTDFLGWVQPDLNVFNGDTMDFPEFSKHQQFPGHFVMNAQEEVDHCVDKIYVPCQKAAPNARHIWVIGNHEYRYVRFVADKASELACFRSMNIIDQFRLRELGIDMVCRSNFLAPTKAMRERDIAENWMVVEGCFVLTHGVFLGKNHDEDHWKRFHMSGTNGHLHTPSLSFFSSVKSGPCSWSTTPMMAGHAVGRDYVSMPSLWQMGFGYIEIDKRTGEVQQHIVTVGDSASFGGRVWRITEEEKEARRLAWAV